MSRITFLLCVFIIALTALTQPGLCPCWLMIDIHAHHPHPDGHPDRPHSHDYLDDLFSAGTPALVTLNLVTAHSLLALLALGSLWQANANERLTASGWIMRLEPPPPRSHISFFSLDSVIA